MELDSEGSDLWPSLRLGKGVEGGSWYHTDVYFHKYTDFYINPHNGTLIRGKTIFLINLQNHSVQFRLGHFQTLLKQLVLPNVCQEIMRQICLFVFTC